MHKIVVIISVFQCNKIARTGSNDVESGSCGPF